MFALGGQDLSHYSNQNGYLRTIAKQIAANIIPAHIFTPSPPTIIWQDIHLWVLLSMETIIA